MTVLSERERVRSRAGKQRNQLDEYLPNLRKALERERDFRVEQLAELAADARRDAAPCAQSGEAKAQAAVREVTLLIANGARQALVDIKRALAAMRAGQYGYCESCTGKLPLALLQAVPQARWCLTCHSAPDHVDEKRRCVKTRHHQQSGAPERDS